MMRRKLSFIGGGEPGALTECFVESDIQRQIRDRFDDECPYSLARTTATRRSPRSPKPMRSCNSQVWQVAVNTMAKKRDTIRRGVNTVFRSMNRLRTGFKVATQVPTSPPPLNSGAKPLWRRCIEIFFEGAKAFFVPIQIFVSFLWGLSPSKT